MATHQIFITGNETTEKRVESDISYFYQDGRIKFYINDNWICTKPANIGDAFLILSKDGKIIFRRMSPPTRKSNLVGWLLGFTKYNRAHTRNFYEFLLKKYREKRYWEGYVEWEEIGEGYMFTQCNREDSDGYHNVACYIHENITKEEVLNLVPLMVYPSFYAKKLLKDAFDISEEEYDNALRIAIKSNCE